MLNPELELRVSDADGGNNLAQKLLSLVLRHYRLASTTVTGIPMKEEQNASSSANYDVELFHLNPDLRANDPYVEISTVTLKWCTPRGSSASDLHPNCTSAVS